MTDAITPQEAHNLIEWIKWHNAMEALDNEGLCRELLKAAPLMGRLSDLCEIAVERLSPGIINKMDDKEPTTEDLAAATRALVAAAQPDPTKESRQ